MGANLKQATDTATATSGSTTTLVERSTDLGLAFECRRKPLLDAATLLCRIADRKSSMPVLGKVAINVTWGSVVFAATDLNVTAVVDSDAWATPITPGSMLVPAKDLLDAIKGLPDGIVKIARESFGITLSCGGAQVTIHGGPARDFPKIPAITPADPALAYVEMDAKVLATLLDTVLPFVCKDETRFHLNGVLLENGPNGLSACATDGHRLAHATCVGPADPFHLPGGILPSKAAKELVKLASAKGGTSTVRLSRIGDHMLIARRNGTTIAMKLIDAQFPPYEQVIPTSNHRTCTVLRKDLLASAKRATKVASDTRGMKLELVPGGHLRVSADHPERGTMSETLCSENSDHGSWFVGLNPRYLVDVLEAMTEEAIVLRFGTNDKRINKDADCFDSQLTPILIKGADQRFVIMPMRI